MSLNKVVEIIIKSIHVNYTKSKLETQVVYTVEKEALLRMNSIDRIFHSKEDLLKSL